MLTGKARARVHATGLACALAALTVTASADVPPRVDSPPTNTERKALSHLFASSMAAAWNARGAADANQAPTVVIGDNWGNGKQGLFGNGGDISAAIVGGQIDPNPQGLSASDHGYHTTGIVFGSFANDGSAPGLVTGAFPKRGKLVPIDGQNDASLWANETKLAPAIAAVPGHLVLNTSLSDGPDASGAEAVKWIDQVRGLGLEDRVFHATAAGNDGASGGTAGAASSWSAAATRQDLEDTGGTHVDPLNNTLAVENVLEEANASALGCLDAQSNTGGSIAAPGTEVRSFNKSGQAINLSGTSQASPLVAGLAAYLWSIAPDLTPQQLVAAITLNADLPGTCPRTSAPLLNAYMAVLSLDQTGAPTAATWPVRFAILDKNGDQTFNQEDLEAFAPKLKRTLTPSARSWSRLDLNGDGFTGGTRTAPFDLDRSGSTRAGPTGLASATASIEGVDVDYDEEAVADADVLCFYAYSPLYAVSSTATTRRRALLKKLCEPSEIAFVSNRDGNAEIYVMNADGAAQTRLTNNPAPDIEPALSPDGSKVAFTSTRDGDFDIFVMDAIPASTATNLTENAASASSPAFSPDGSKIAFTGVRVRDGKANADIYVMDAIPGSTATRLTNHANPDSFPAFSPDGSKIAFASTRDGGNIEEIYVMKADGSAETRLTNNPASDTEPAFSPGSKIAFTRDGDIYVMNANGSAQTNLTNNAAGDLQPAFSPDGSKIAFTSTRDGNLEIFVMDAIPGSTATNLTNNAAFDSQPDW